MDCLFINPVSNWELKQQNIMGRRVDESIPNLETPHLGIASLMAVAKQHGISFSYIDMEMDRKGINDVLDFIEKERPSLIGFTAFTHQVKVVGRLAQAIKERWPDSFIVIGGPHAIGMPVDTLHEFYCH